MSRGLHEVVESTYYYVYFVNYVLFKPIFMYLLHSLIKCCIYMLCQYYFTLITMKDIYNEKVTCITSLVSASKTFSLRVRLLIVSVLPDTIPAAYWRTHISGVSSPVTLGYRVAEIEFESSLGHAFLLVTDRYLIHCVPRRCSTRLN